MRLQDEKEARILTRFLEIFCREKHKTNSLCPECSELLEYAKKRLSFCPYDPKPKCKNCSTHCYAPKYRERIRAVMRFSGMYAVKRGRLDWLFHYLIRK